MPKPVKQRAVVVLYLSHSGPALESRCGNWSWVKENLGLGTDYQSEANVILRVEASESTAASEALGFELFADHLCNRPSSSAWEQE